MKLTAAAALLGVAALMSSWSASASEPLLYRLTPGDWRVYEQRVRQPDAQPAELTRQVQLWCLEERPDGWLILLDQIEIADGRTRPIAGVLLTLDARGELRFETEMLPRVARFADALTALPPLRPAHAGAGGWTTAADPFGKAWVCERPVVDPNYGVALRVTYQCADATGADAHLGRATGGSFWFDASQGTCVLSVRRTYDARGRLERQVVARLRDSKRHGPRWLQLRRRERERWLQTVRREARLIEQLHAGAAELDAVMAQLTQQWRETVRDLASAPESPFYRLALGCRRALPAEAERLARTAALAQAWTQRPLEFWALQDPNGVTVRSETLRGQPRLECLWRGNQDASLRTLAELRAVRASASERGVRLLGLNLDADPQVARVAARACGGGLEHVLAEPLSASWPAVPTPAFRLVDAAGRVRWAAFGWRPSLAPLIERSAR